MHFPYCWLDTLLNATTSISCPGVKPAEFNKIHQQEQKIFCSHLLLQQDQIDLNICCVLLRSAWSGFNICVFCCVCYIMLCFMLNVDFMLYFTQTLKRVYRTWNGFKRKHVNPYIEVAYGKNFLTELQVLSLS